MDNKPTATETRYDPWGISVKDGLCTKCSNQVQVSTEIGRTVRECYSCKYGMRPFASGSSHAAGPCSCTWSDVLTNTHTCRTCKFPKCDKCGNALGSDGTVFNTDGKLCRTCCDIKKKMEFGQRWANMTPAQKLQLHGKTKLQILAKKRNMSVDGTREPLIERLAPGCTDRDFPIRS
jgi:hypothetical protein